MSVINQQVLLMSAARFSSLVASVVGPTKAVLWNDDVDSDLSPPSTGSKKTDTRMKDSKSTTRKRKERPKVAYCRSMRARSPATKHTDDDWSTASQCSRQKIRPAVAYPRIPSTRSVSSQQSQDTHKMRLPPQGYISDYDSDEEVDYDAYGEYDDVVVSKLSSERTTIMGNITQPRQSAPSKEPLSLKKDRRGSDSSPSLTGTAPTSSSTCDTSVGSDASYESDIAVCWYQYPTVPRSSSAASASSGCSLVHSQKEKKPISRPIKESVSPTKASNAPKAFVRADLIPKPIRSTLSAEKAQASLAPVQGVLRRPRATSPASVTCPPNFDNNNDTMLLSKAPYHEATDDGPSEKANGGPGTSQAQENISASVLKRSNSCAEVDSFAWDGHMGEDNFWQMDLRDESDYQVSQSIPSLLREFQAASNARCTVAM